MGIFGMKRECKKRKNGQEISNFGGERREFAISGGMRVGRSFSFPR